MKMNKINQMSVTQLNSVLRECDAAVRLMGSIGMQSSEKYTLSVQAAEAIRIELKKR